MFEVRMLHLPSNVFRMSLNMGKCSWKLEFSRPVIGHRDRRSNV